MIEEASKSKKAFFRKLYIAYLIDTGKQNLVSLEAETGMHKRTLQTAMCGLSDIGIEYEFVQEGIKNKHGYYRLNTWGSINKIWIKENLQYVIDVLQQ